MKAQQKEEKRKKNTTAAFRGEKKNDGEIVTEEEIGEVTAPKKELEPYEAIFDFNTSFFSTNNPDLIEETMIKHLMEEFKCEP